MCCKSLGKLMWKKLIGSSISDAVLAAMNKSLAIIEFDPAGSILTANDNFLHAMGYEARELAGQHHRMFVDTDYARSAEYAAFWQKLGRGEFDAAEYKRLGKGGREVWIQDLQPGAVSLRKGPQGGQVRYRHHRRQDERCRRCRKAASHIARPGRD